MKQKGTHWLTRCSLANQDLLAGNAMLLQSAAHVFTRGGSNTATHRAAVAGVCHIQRVADTQRTHRSGAVALAAAQQEGQAGVSGCYMQSKHSRRAMLAAALCALLQEQGQANAFFKPK